MKLLIVIAILFTACASPPVPNMTNGLIKGGVYATEDVGWDHVPYAGGR